MQKSIKKTCILIMTLALLIVGVSVGDTLLAPYFKTSENSTGHQQLLTPLLSLGGVTEQDQAEDESPIGTFAGPFLRVMPISPTGQSGNDEATFAEDMEPLVPRSATEDESAERGGPFLQVFPGETAQPQSEYVSELAPSTIVYVGGTTIPLSSYQTKSGKYLWIESPNGLLEYASIPKSRDYYPSLSLIAYTSIGGPGEILEMFPGTSNQGTYIKTYYNFNPGYNWIPYRGDVSGRHYLLFSMGDQSSNAVIIDVDKGMIGDSPVLGTMPS